jgi:imidazolonepropionase
MTARSRTTRPTRGDGPAAPPSVLIVHAAELLTLRGASGPRVREAAGDLGIIEDGAVFAEGGLIRDVGLTAEVVSRHPQAHVMIDATGKVVMPGFVDSHTHPVFAGSRAHEVEWKAQGLGYAEIAARGGGILHTVRATREATEDELVREGAARFHAMSSFGTTTLEAKSGYGLGIEPELKLLRAIDRAARTAGVDAIPTFLGAHAVPAEFQGRTDEYARLVEGDMLDAVASSRLATFCDVFVDSGYFSVDQGRRILERARKTGLRAKVHADELADTGGAAMAAEVRAASADHLNHASSVGVEAMARAGVVAVLLPATCVTSRLPFADGRRLIAAGVPVALGTDFSPNCWCESMQLVIALACHHNGLTPAEAIVGATVNAAHAIGREGEVGTLESGRLADLLVLDVPSAPHLGYRLGGNTVEVVVKRGHVVHSRLTK